MPTTPRPTTRVVLRWAAAVTLLAGLFAMHGLPMEQPGAAMSSAMTDHTTAGHTAMPAPAPDLLPTAVGCTTADHCTATLRAVEPLATPAPVEARRAAADPVAATGLQAVTRPARAPPDLLALGISRT